MPQAADAAQPAALARPPEASQEANSSGRIPQE